MVYRLGTELVNWYLVEEDERVTVVDAGVPGYWPELEPKLREIGRGMPDVEAVVLTHAHMDHIGVAERLRKAGATVYVHEADEEMAREGKLPKNERTVVPYLRHATTWKLFGHLIRNRTLPQPKVKVLQTFADGDVLDVPGAPRVVHTPGHSPGHCVLHFEEEGALFVGDALCSRNPMTGREGPQLMPAAFQGDLDGAEASLERLAGLDAAVMHFGHGEPWEDGPAACVERAREAGRS